jgi:poly(3-hydroxybutyrate) depolymerase
MLAIYPEVFAAGAIIAGVPFGVATKLREAIRGMMQGTEHSAPELSDLVHRASKNKGPWPKLSVWHGSADRIVHASNADAVVRQWVNVHGLPLAPTSISYVDGHSREIWRNSDGETVIESYAVSDMGHGTPLGLAHDGERYGAEGALFMEAGISSTANFFGLPRLDDGRDALFERLRPADP